MKHIGNLGFDFFNTYWIYRDEEGEWEQLAFGFYWRVSKTHIEMRPKEDE